MEQIRKLIKYFFVLFIRKLKRIILILYEFENSYSNKKLVLDLGSTFAIESRVYNLKSKPNDIKIGKGSFIRGELLIFPYGGEISIGHNCYIGAGVRIWSGEKVIIGNNVMIAHNVNIIDFAHERDFLERAEGFRNLLIKGHPFVKGNIPTQPIIIEDDVIIYAGSSIVMGVTIGKGSIVGTGCVVMKDIPPFSQVIGNPAKVVGKLSV